MENTSPVEWSRLETQDPSGRLKKLNFERIIKKLTTLSSNRKTLEAANSGAENE